MAKPKIISSEPCKYQDVSCDFFGYQKWFKEEISYNQAIEDLDMLVIFQNQLMQVTMMLKNEV